MALDGAFLRHVKKELEERILEGRVDKIHQPNKDEIVMSFRTREGASRLLLSARANNPRVNFLTDAPENPEHPPMLCMLLRKKLQGARLAEIRQSGLERALHFVFDATNELGDRIRLMLTIEIMGKYSNIILSDENDIIIDALKRVDAEMSSQRLVLPGTAYSLPPVQDKLNIMEAKSSDIVSKIKALPKDTELPKALLNTIQGVSPVVCRELEYQIGKGRELSSKTLGDEDSFRLGFFLQKLKETISDISGRSYMVLDKKGKPLDFSFMEIHYLGTSAVTREYESFSELLEAFYSERDRRERMKVKEQDLLKLLSNIYERTTRKINNQRAELEKSIDREKLKVQADLLSANLYAIPKGAESVSLMNFYDERQSMLDIKLEPALTPQQNAQRYYKEYSKAKTAEIKLKEQLELAEEELKYIDSVFESLTLAENERDLSEIKTELADEGYLRIIRSKRDKIKQQSEPLSFTVSDGFRVLVGRNNTQNDKLTLKTARKQDIWFHTKNIPGSHTVLVTDGKEPTEKAVQDAADLAAKYSRGREAGQVAVDYTAVKNVTKPHGAKPGMVIYNNFKTIYGNPLL